MSVATPTQNSQVISVLCKQGLLFGGLLSALQRRYPTGGWTSASLTNVLNQGVKRGRFLKSTNGGYQVNPKMVFSDYTNVAYSGSCGLDPTPCSCTQSPASANDQ